MHFAKINMTTFSVGLVVSVLGSGCSSRHRLTRSSATGSSQRMATSPTAAASRSCPGIHRGPMWSVGLQPGAIVMGADPDPFIRQQLLRDADGFFGGNR
jgi:hypothetical protein